MLQQRLGRGVDPGEVHGVLGRQIKNQRPAPVRLGTRRQRRLGRGGHKAGRGLSLLLSLSLDSDRPAPRVWLS